MPTINSDPYPWPFDGSLAPETTALIIIDMQTDFCGPGGYVDRMGYDLNLTRAPLEPIARLLAAMRARSYPIIHTREGHRPDLSDLPRQQTLALPPKHRRRNRRPRPLRPRPHPRRARLGNHPRTRSGLPGEPIIDKPGKGSFCATDLELLLHVTKRHPTTSSSPASPPTSASTPPCAKPTTAASNASWSKTAAAPPTPPTTPPR